MAFNARIFGYRGIIQIQQIMVKQFNADSVFLLDEPYVWSQVLVVNGAVPVASAPNNDRTVQILRVEVPDGQQIRYEINPNGQGATTTRAAGNLSPRLAGFDQFAWGVGYTISMVDAASFV